MVTFKNYFFYYGHLEKSDFSEYKQ
jgi:hypothetical protein